MRIEPSLVLLTSLALCGACGPNSGADPVGATAPEPAEVQLGAPSGLGPNDVSVLFPDLGAALWPASLAAYGGALLPASEFARLDLSLVREREDVDEYAALRVVSLRFDPCFRTELGGTCQPQIRLVFQVPDPQGGFFDGALHALYALTPERLATVVAELARLAQLAPENAGVAALGVSPALRAQGIEGPYARALRALVVAHAGEASLVRMTFMSRTFARSGQWQFGGFAARGDKLAIASIDATQQNVTRSVGHAFEYTVTPLFGEAAGRPGASSAGLDALPADARATVHDWAMRQEDPASQLPDTTDCASCHLSGHVARHLESLDPTLLTPPIVAARAARAIGSAEEDGDNLRAFGWMGKVPHVAQRTANETAAVVRAFVALR